MNAPNTRPNDPMVQRKKPSRPKSSPGLRPSLQHLLVPALLLLLLVLLLILPALIPAILTRQQFEENLAYYDMDLDPPPIVQRGAPVIGILTQVLRDYKRFTDTHHLHMAASYVKWIESAGGQVLPVLLNQEPAYYERIFNQTNGLLLPGGDNMLDPHVATPMMVAARQLYRLAVQANDRGDYYPIWGTCLGLELLSVLSADRNVLEDCSANDLVLPLEFVARGNLFAAGQSLTDLPLSDDYAQVIVRVLRERSVVYHYHHKCLTDAGLKETGLGDFYRPLAYSSDANGKRFITAMEAKRYPFFAVQFHPEKPPFEFVIKSSQQWIPHSRDAIAVSRYFGDFFVQMSQRSKHRARPPPDELIYSHQATFTAPKHDMYEQRYLFPWQAATGSVCPPSNGTELNSNSNNNNNNNNNDDAGLAKRRRSHARDGGAVCLTVEFLDHVPDEDEMSFDEDPAPAPAATRAVGRI